MSNEFAFFQLENRNDGNYLLLYPGTDGSKPDIHDVEAYLLQKHLDYDKTALMTSIAHLNGPGIVKLKSESPVKEDEALLIHILDNATAAVVKFVPPSNHGKLLNKEEITAELVRAGVRYGLDEKLLDEYMRNRQYCKPYELAKYKPAVEGKNAVVTYHFNTNLSRKPKLQEDGSVDFHQLDMINSVKRGDCLATLTPAVLGQPGIDVMGHVIKPATVKPYVFRPVKNAEISEDGLQLRSLIDGHVSLIDNVVFLSNVYEVPADVDTSTGDVNFEGSVCVRGNVRTGFSIKVSGDVIVEGVVEGARIEAGGQIVLKRGIQGMGKGYLNAGSNIISKFIENAEVHSGGFVTSDTIMHSRVSAKGEVTTSGKKGFIIGGEIHSGAGISVKSAGSMMGTPTLLEVGVDPKLMEEYHALDGELPKLEEENEKINQIITVLSKKIKSGERLSPEKLTMLKEAAKSKQMLEEKIKLSLARMDELQEMAGQMSRGSISASDVIYPGCKIVLYNVPYHVRSELKYCRLIKDRAEVKLVAY